MCEERKALAILLSTRYFNSAQVAKYKLKDRVGEVVVVTSHENYLEPHDLCMEDVEGTWGGLSNYQLLHG